MAPGAVIDQLQRVNLTRWHILPILDNRDGTNGDVGPSSTFFPVVGPIPLKLDWGAMTDFADTELDGEPEDIGAGTPPQSGPNGAESGADRSAQYAQILDAPDYSQFVKRPTTKISREYRDKMRAMLKSALVGAININDFPDAAAIVHYGPDFSIATGDLADTDERVRGMLDLITSPGNPYVSFLLAGLPFAAQLFRNHQPQIDQMQMTRKQRRAYRREHPEAIPRTTFKLGRFNINVRFKVRNPLKMFFGGIMSQTSDPGELTYKVFSDEKLVSALEKQGIRISFTNDKT